MIELLPKLGQNSSNFIIHLTYIFIRNAKPFFNRLESISIFLKSVLIYDYRPIEIIFLVKSYEQNVCNSKNSYFNEKYFERYDLENFVCNHFRDMIMLL